MKRLKTVVRVKVLVFAFLSINSWALCGSGVVRQTYTKDLILEANKLIKLVIINFHADWCLPCIKLKQKTFSHQDFVLAAKDFTLVKVDLTERTNPKHEALIEKYKISGMPTIIFLDNRGIEQRDLRVEEFSSPLDFRIRMAKLVKHYGKTTENTASWCI